MRNIKGGMTTLYAIVAVIVVGLANVPALAAEATVIKFNEWVKEFAIKGDLRLRHESQHRSDQHNGSPSTALTASNRDRHRQRLRLRLGMDFKLPANVTAKFQFASGTGEQVSTNQSFDTASNEKEFWIDRAFLEWAPRDTIKFTGGKMANPLYIRYTSDILYDSDWNPEGFGQSLASFALPRTKVFLTGMQVAIDEDSAGTQDQWLLSNQLGGEILMFEESKFTALVGLHEWINERVGNFGQGTLGSVGQEGNTTTGGNYVSTNTLASEFRVLEYTGEYRTSLFNIPMALQGTLITNIKAMQAPALNKGFQYGAIFGQAKRKGGLELATFYKRVEADATVAMLADSDFGPSGGTNRKGFIGWLAWAPSDWSVLQLKHFVTKRVNTDILAPAAIGANPHNRTQLDLTVKF